MCHFLPHLEVGHVGVALLVVSRVYDDFIKNFVETRHEGHHALHDAVRRFIVNPHLLSDLLRGPDWQGG